MTVFCYKCRDSTKWLPQEETVYIKNQLGSSRKKLDVVSDTEKFILKRGYYFTLQCDDELFPHRPVVVPKLRNNNTHETERLWNGTMISSGKCSGDVFRVVLLLVGVVLHVCVSLNLHNRSCLFL